MEHLLDAHDGVREVRVRLSRRDAGTVGSNRRFFGVVARLDDVVELVDACAQLPIFAFVSRGTDTFIAGDPAAHVSFMDIIWKANAKIEETGSEVLDRWKRVVSPGCLYDAFVSLICCCMCCQSEMCTASALFWIVLHHCKGRVDAFAKVRLSCHFFLYRSRGSSFQYVQCDTVLGVNCTGHCRTLLDEDAQGDTNGV